RSPQPPFGCWFARSPMSRWTGKTQDTTERNVRQGFARRPRATAAIRDAPLGLGASASTFPARGVRVTTLDSVFASSHPSGIDGGVEIELVRGTRRRKYVEAVLVGDRLRVSFPRWMSVADAQATANELAERMRRRVDPSCIDVASRARRLAK